MLPKLYIKNLSYGFYFGFSFPFGSYLLLEFINILLHMIVVYFLIVSLRYLYFVCDWEGVGAFCASVSHVIIHIYISIWQNIWLVSYIIMNNQRIYFRVTYEH
jgi:hypothetical protein